jgi:1,4-dihydroxy-2-naphthoate octaprenyltransferase
VTLGTVLAWREGCFNLTYYLLAVTVGILLQVGTNMVNTYYDYLNGVDTVASSGESNPILVMKWLKPPAVLKGGYLAFVLAALSGLYLVLLRGWPLLLLGLVGILGGYGYTARPLAYKYRGLGVPIVFVLMGPLMVLGGYVVQSGYWQWLPVLVSLPVGFLVAAILHGNDLRDIETDRLAAVKTLSHLLGNKTEYCYYFLLLGAYLSTVLLVAGNLLPWPALLPMLLLPQGVKLACMVRGGFKGNLALLGPVEPLTANLHLRYGMLFIAGLLLAGPGL